MQKNVFKIYDGRTNFWQWDKKQKLIVLDDNVTEVHFSNRNMTHSIKRAVYEDGNGNRVCNVPDDLLKIPRNLVAYVSSVSSDSCSRFSHTVFTRSNRVASSITSLLNSTNRG